MISLTALILTYNEKENIERTLSALAWVPQILVVDSFSKDQTVEIAKSFAKVSVIQRAFDSHTMQWNFGLAQVTTPWVFSLDADYEVSPELSVEVQRLEPSDDVSGYSARFQFRIYGRPLRTSVYPPRTVLFRGDRADYRPDGHTQLLAVKGTVERFQGMIYHDDRKPLSRWIGSQDRYTQIEARHLLSLPSEELSTQDKLRLKLIAPVVMLFYLLFVRGLLLDGWPGCYYVCQRTIAELLLSLRLLIEEHRLEPKLEERSVPDAPDA